MWLCRHRGRLRCRGRLRRTLLGEAPRGEQLALFLRHPQRPVSWKPTVSGGTAESPLWWKKIVTLSLSPLSCVFRSNFGLPCASSQTLTRCPISFRHPVFTRLLPSFLSIRSRRILDFPLRSQGERTIKAEALQACTGTILLVLNVEDKTGSIFKSNSQEPKCVRCCSRFLKTLLPTFLSPCPFRPVALSPQVP